MTSKEQPTEAATPPVPSPKEVPPPKSEKPGKKPIITDYASL
ncbi:MAG: hypothetical protein AAF943_06940 [Pseudomonadota bacterium]